jgi:SAM-dependent methyltransferase
VVLGAVPAGCQRALDVACGQGALTRRLRSAVPQVSGIDRDARSIELARGHPGAGDIGYLLGDFRAAPLQPGSFDLVTSVAVVHHMDAAAALRQMAALLRPDGVLAVVGLARDAWPGALGPLVAAVPGSQLHRAVSAWQLRGTGGRPGPGYTSPIVWPPPLTYPQMRRLAHDVLPGVRYRHHLYWRYSLVWAKPAAG